MNMGVYLFLLLFALMFSGMPIALGVGMAAILTTGIWGQIGLELIFQQYYQGVPIWGQSVVEVRQAGMVCGKPSLSGKMVTRIEQDLASAKPI